MHAGSARNRPALAFTTAIASMVVASCGAGTAGIFAGAGGGSGGSGSSAPPSLSFLEVSDSKVSPAGIRFVLADPDSDSAQVTFYYRAAGSAQRVPITQLFDANDATPVPNAAAFPADGVERTLRWRFVDEAALPSDGSYAGTIEVSADVGGGTTTQPFAAGVGNDAPEIESVTPPDAEESTGNVDIGFLVKDSSSDLVDVRVEYRVSGGTWQGARPAGTPAGEDTPVLAFENLETTPGGVAETFVWDSAFDLSDDEVDVTVRIRADDPAAQGAWEETPSPFRIDNNAPPIAFLHGDVLVANPDGKRGIPVPFRVVDEEGDPLRLVFQWAPPGGPFPDLPAEADLEAALSDPEQRRLLQVCDEYPRVLSGNVVPVDTTSVRLPELARGVGGGLAAGGLDLQTLELLRPSTPAPLRVAPESAHTVGTTSQVVTAGATAAAPVFLREPVAVCASPQLGDSEVVVLERTRAGAWRLVCLDLAGGGIRWASAEQASGEPSVVAAELGRESFVVAAADAGAWHLVRVDGEGRDMVSLATWAAPLPTGEVRGLLSVGSDALLLTVGDALLRADVSEPSNATITTVLDGLSEPWGLARDPLDPRQVLLAERSAPTGSGAGRIVRVRPSTRSLQVLDLVGPEGALIAGLRPEDLELDRRGGRLMVIADRDPLDGTKELASVELLLHADGIAEPSPLRDRPLVGSASGIGFARDQSQVIAARDEGLYVAGGIEQRREIRAVDPEDPTRVEVLAPFGFEPARGQPWRIVLTRTRFRAAAAGREGVFVWDASGLPGRELVVRVVPLDSEEGTGDATSSGKLLHTAFDVAPVPIGPQARAALLDVHGDGDLDFVGADGDVHVWSCTGSYSTPSQLALSFGGDGVAVGDIDGDGRTDVVTCADGASAWVHYRSDTGFDVVRDLQLPPLDQQRDVEVGDIDGDGDQDIVVAAYQDGFQGASYAVALLQTGVGPDQYPIFETTVLSCQGCVHGTTTTLGDADDDGVLDVAVAGNHRIWLYRFEGGAFSQQQLGGPNQTLGLDAAWIGDVNQDGRADVVGADTGGTAVWAFYRRADGGYDAPVELGRGATGEPFGVDLDLDGDLDLAAGRLLLYQDRPGVWSKADLAFFGTPDLQLVPAPPLDLDLDGRVDLIGWSGGQLVALQQQSPGRFRYAQSTYLDTGFHVETTPLEFVDLDGDGDADKLSGAGNILRIRFQLSPGVFAVSPLELGPGSAAVVRDVNRDGLLDIVSVAHERLDIHRQDAEHPGSFVTESVSTLMSGVLDDPRALDLGDFDGDGHLDVVVASYGGRTVSVFHGSPGGFDRPPQVVEPVPGVAVQWTAVATGDVDGDGLDEFIVGQSWAFAVDRTARGEYVSSLLTTGSIVHDLWVGDVDRDRDVDVVLADNNALKVLIKESDGYRAQVIHGHSPRSVSVGDVDGDGDLDLAAVSYYTSVPCSSSFDYGTVAVYEQTSPGRFSDRAWAARLSDQDRYYKAALADVDGDGDLDFIANRANGAEVIVLWGGR